MKNILGAILMVSLAIAFLYGCKKIADNILYFKFYNITYSVLRDSGNCNLVLDTDKLQASDLNKSQAAGMVSAYEEWKLVCSLKEVK